MSTLENLITHLHSFKQHHVRIEQDLLDKIRLQPMENWQDNLIEQIKGWTCDSDLQSISGRNGYYLSEYLVNFLLKDFFKNQSVVVYKLLPDWGDWPWGDHMSEEYVFETEEKIYIMHFGESS